jgi:hypothetical protein
MPGSTRTVRAGHVSADGRTAARSELTEPLTGSDTWAPAPITGPLQPPASSTGAINLRSAPATIRLPVWQKHRKVRARQAPIIHFPQALVHTQLAGGSQRPCCFMVPGGPAPRNPLRDRVSRTLCNRRDEVASSKPSSRVRRLARAACLEAAALREQSSELCVVPVRAIPCPASPMADDPCPEDGRRRVPALQPAIPSANDYRGCSMSTKTVHQQMPTATQLCAGHGCV